MTINVRLTDYQIRNLINFIEFEFIDSIRKDADIDNINYIIDMMDALKSLRVSLVSTDSAVSSY